ncbi:mucin-2-like [Rhincodon typus]|uniref:mucin-2-like n=1 Tax=Rhincodon typus TaxID=259920 RepID=UPI00202F388F|nr:mucin-2-like [Rhincodon typus]
MTCINVSIFLNDTLFTETCTVRIQALCIDGRNICLSSQGTTSTKQTATTTSTTASSTPETTKITETTTTGSTTARSTAETSTITETTTTGSTTASSTAETTTTTEITTPQSTTASSTPETTTTTETTTTSSTTGSSTPETTTTTETTTPPSTPASSTTETTTTIETTTTPSTTASSTTEETTTTVKTTTEVPCNGKWSVWINNNKPSVEQTHDKEPLDPIRDTVCQSYGNKITNIQCEALKFPGYPISKTNDTVTCDLDSGLICHRPASGALTCLDYRIRVCCEPFETTTLPTTTTSVSRTTTPEKCYCNSDPPRKCNETWQQNCETITCVIAQTYEITKVPCSVPVKPTCYSGLEPKSLPTKGGCCSTWDCDCNCQLWGNRHYRTFDGLYYNFFRNCTYVLVQEKVPRYNFSVILDNYDCAPQSLVSCPKTLIINYNGYVIYFSTQKPSVSVNGIEVNFPYHGKEFNFTKNYNKVTIYIPAIRTTIIGINNSFRISVPEQYFLDNTQGQCGSCSRNIKDECTRRNGNLEPLDCCDKTALDWKVNNPNKAYCAAAPTKVPCEAPPTPLPCVYGKTVCDIISGDSFRHCRNRQDLTKYIKACQNDHCAVNSTELECSGVEAAAAICNAAGTCVDWRASTNGLCSYNCPFGFTYKACARYNDNYCKDGVMISGERFDERVEGCFCPNGMMLSEDRTQCIPSCTRCKDNAGNLRYEGESWSHPNDTCIHYQCSGGVVTKTQITCSSRPTCDEANKTWDSYHCCYDCHQELKLCKVNKKQLNVTKNGCSANIEVQVCDGYCESFAMFNPEMNGMERKCSCCNENETETKAVMLQCPNGTTQQYSYISVKSCQCKICAGSQVS